MSELQMSLPSSKIQARLSQQMNYLPFWEALVHVLIKEAICILITGPWKDPEIMRMVQNGDHKCSRSESHAEGEIKTSKEQKTSKLEANVTSQLSLVPEECFLSCFAMAQMKSTIHALANELERKNIEQEKMKKKMEKWELKFERPLLHNNATSSLAPIQEDNSNDNDMSEGKNDHEH